MSRTFSTNSGSLESLKVSTRCGCSAKARQMGLGAQIRAGASAKPGTESMGSALPVVWMTDALQGQRGAPPQGTSGALQGGQLAGVRRGAPAARQPDGLGDAGGLGGLAPAQDGPAGPVAAVRGHC